MTLKKEKKKGEKVLKKKKKKTYRQGTKKQITNESQM